MQEGYTRGTSLSSWLVLVVASLLVRSASAAYDATATIDMVSIENLVAGRTVCGDAQHASLC